MAAKQLQTLQDLGNSYHNQLKKLKQLQQPKATKGGKFIDKAVAKGKNIFAKAKDLAKKLVRKLQNSAKLKR